MRGWLRWRANRDCLTVNGPGCWKPPPRSVRGFDVGRIRTLKPEFFKSRSLAQCPLEARMTFAGLWVEADDHGRGIADPRILKGAIWPLDDDVTHERVAEHLQTLVDTAHIILYDVDGEAYYEVVRWEDHQASAYRRGDPKYPAPQGGLNDVSHKCVQKSASRTQMRAVTGNREQGTGKAHDDALFEDFWQRYPRGRAGKPGGDGSKKPALQKWRRLSEEERKLCLSAVDHYRQHVESDGGPIAAHAVTWLNQERWDQWQEPARVAGRSIGTGGVA